ncbi:MAG TPA: DNA-directed RNA polymerase subunit omega [Dissulfurispiraceae bacterium]|nr:DNA-directed RNA polymerase subunit omega [Dissulfurispiraceae bacterium]
MDIITLPIEYDKKKIESKYRLAVIASQRARELAFGAEPRISKKVKRISTLSLLETIGGDIKFLTGEDAAVARERAEKIDFRKLIEDKRKSITDISELEKDLKTYLHERETTERVLEELFSENDENYES